MAGWGNFLGKIADQFAGRIERLKNEKERLINEREILKSKPFSASGSRRITVLDNRLRVIQETLENNAHD